MNVFFVLPHGDKIKTKLVTITASKRYQLQLVNNSSCVNLKRTSKNSSVMFVIFSINSNCLIDKSWTIKLIFFPPNLNIIWIKLSKFQYFFHFLTFLSVPGCLSWLVIFFQFFCWWTNISFNVSFVATLISAYLKGNKSS